MVKGEWENRPLFQDICLVTPVTNLQFPSNPTSPFPTPSQPLYIHSHPALLTEFFQFQYVPPKSGSLQLTP